MSAAAANSQVKGQWTVSLGSANRRLPPGRARARRSSSGGMAEVRAVAQAPPPPTVRAKGAPQRTTLNRKLGRETRMPTRPLMFIFRSSRCVCNPTPFSLSFAFVSCRGVFARLFYVSVTGESFPGLCLVSWTSVLHHQGLLRKCWGRNVRCGRTGILIRPWKCLL